VHRHAWRGVRQQQLQQQLRPHTGSPRAVRARFDSAAHVVRTEGVVTMLVLRAQEPLTGVSTLGVYDSKSNSSTRAALSMTRPITASARGPSMGMGEVPARMWTVDGRLRGVCERIPRRGERQAHGGTWSARVDSGHAAGSRHGFASARRSRCSRTCRVHVACYLCEADARPAAQGALECQVDQALVRGGRGRGASASAQAFEAPAQSPSSLAAACCVLLPALAFRIAAQQRICRGRSTRACTCPASARGPSRLAPGPRGLRCPQQWALLCRACRRCPVHGCRRRLWRNAARRRGGAAGSTRRQQQCDG
jgi:hypothetical protein